MSPRNLPANSSNTEMGRPTSPDPYGASPEKKHKAGFSDPKKRKIEDTEDGEVHEEAGFLDAKRHRPEFDMKQGSAQSDQKGASSQAKNDSKDQEVDEMDTDSNKKDDGLDAKLTEATKKMGIKPADEVKNDMDWAEIYSHKYWPFSGTSGSRN